MLAIPVTTLTAGYTTLFEGDIPYTQGYLIVHNGAVEVSLQTGPGQGQRSESPGLPAEPGVYPFGAGSPGAVRPGDVVYGVAARQLGGVASVPAQTLYGAAFRAGDSFLMPVTTLDSTMSGGGVVTPPAAGGGGMALIADQTLSANAASIDFNAIPQT